MDAIVLGKLVIPHARLAALIGLATAGAVAARFARREPALRHWAGTAAVVGLVVGRAAYVLNHLDAYADAPLSALYVWDGEFSLLWAGAAVLVFTLLRLGARLAPTSMAALALGAGLMSWLGAGYALQAFTPEGTDGLPRLSLEALGGERVQLRQFGGKPVVLNLWASWCPPCRREMPVLARAATENEDVSFVFVNQGEDETAIRGFLKSSGVRLEHVLLDPDSSVARHFRSRALPTTLFFTADGRLAATHLGAVSAARLSDYLGQLN